MTPSSATIVLGDLSRPPRMALRNLIKKLTRFAERIGILNSSASDALLKRLDGRLSNQHCGRTRSTFISKHVYTHFI